LDRHPYIKVIGIAGPGEPLANEQTFITLELLEERYPHLIKCLSSNGLLLAEKLERLRHYRVAAITVTLNAVSPHIGARIYGWIEYEGQTYRGIEGARLLMRQQLTGILEASKAGLCIKVNTVYIPDINGAHLPEIAQLSKEYGAAVQNIIPLIPQHQLARLRPPSWQELREVRERCSRILPQLNHCRQCRADALGRLDQRDHLFLS